MWASSWKPVRAVVRSHRSHVRWSTSSSHATFPYLPFKTQFVTSFGKFFWSFSIIGLNAEWVLPQCLVFFLLPHPWGAPHLPFSTGCLLWQVLLGRESLPSKKNISELGRAERVPGQLGRAPQEILPCASWSSYLSFHHWSFFNSFIKFMICLFSQTFLVFW